MPRTGWITASAPAHRIVEARNSLAMALNTKSQGYFSTGAGQNSGGSEVTVPSFRAKSIPQTKIDAVFKASAPATNVVVEIVEKSTGRVLSRIARDFLEAGEEVLVKTITKTRISGNVEVRVTNATGTTKTTATAFSTTTTKYYPI